MKYISKKEYENFANKVIEIKGKKVELEKAIGDIMSNSGSFASKTPGYNETVSAIEGLEDHIKEIGLLLEETEIIDDLSIFSEDEVTLYSLVTIKDKKTGEENKYYIQYEFIADMDKDFFVATPVSPIGKEILGKKTGENFLIGDSEMEIVNIEKMF